ncbi:MAG: DNA polymerase III subunit [Verrucomicrobiae bacterium]|nr:DNA polymerase III subunit [Verrucomicrobiae bacterium]
MPWRDLPSQPLVCDLLQRALKNGRLHHAWLLCGEEAETEAVALAFTQALNCEKAPDDFCGKCASCTDIAAGRHPDVGALRAVSKSRQIRITQLRELERSVYLKAARAAVKVAILHTADRMNEAAQNAFLKTLEEPPPKTVFLLLTEEPQQLLETVLSRCLRVPFRPGADRPKNAREAQLEAWLDEFLARPSEIPAPFRAFGIASRFLGMLKTIKEEKQAEFAAEFDEAARESLEPAQRKAVEEQMDAQAQAEYLRERTRLLKGVLRWLHRRGAPPAALFQMEQLARALARNANEPLALEVAFLSILEAGGNLHRANTA